MDSNQGIIQDGEPWAWAVVGEQDDEFDYVLFADEMDAVDYCDHGWYYCEHTLEVIPLYPGAVGESRRAAGLAKRPSDVEGQLAFEEMT